MLPTKYQVNWLLGLREAKIDLQDVGHGDHLGFPIGTILAILIYKLSRCFLPCFNSTDLSVQEKKRIIDIHDGRLGFQIRNI